MKAALLLLVIAAPQCLADEPGFAPLFDKETLAGWTLLPREQSSGEWRIEGDSVVADGKPGNLATNQEFGDFDLRLEWKIGRMGNSGVFYRVAKPGNPASAAIEYQIADNARKASVENPDRRAGAAYGLYAPPEGVSRPPGEWNSLRIVARGHYVEHWLNGHKVADFEIGSDDFRRRVTAKFPDQADYAAARRGRIVLQDHGSKVWFRNARIRTLD